MKHYITVAAALLLSAVLIFNSAVNAASISLSVLIPQTTRLNLVNQYFPPYDSTDNPIGDVAIYTYSGSIDVSISGISVDSYCNGLFRFFVTPSVSVPAGYSFQATNVSISGLTEHFSYFTTYQRSTTNAGVTTFSCYFDNHSQHNSGVASVAVMDFTVTITKPITTSNLPDPEPYITLSTTASISNNLVSATTEPIDYGFAAVMREAILNAINDNSMPFDDILQVLEDIRTQDQTNYTNIVAYLADNDTFNSTLYTWLTTVLEDNFTDLLDDTTYISSVLNAARNLINSMNNRDSLYYPIFEAALDLANTRLQTLINLMSETPAEAASMENAINQMESKQAAINDYSLPAAGNIMGNANSYVNQGSAGMNLLATILNQPLYILILMTVISLAFVSYLLYGKGV